MRCASLQERARIENGRRAPIADERSQAGDRTNDDARGPYVADEHTLATRRASPAYLGGAAWPWLTGCGVTWEDPYAEVDAFALRARAGRGSRWRAGVLVLGEYSVSRSASVPDGAVILAGTAELTGFSNGTLATDDTAGVAFGEWGIGLFAGPGLRIGSAGTPWAFSGGLTARIPMALGVTCCLRPDFFPSKGERRGKRRNPKQQRETRRFPRNIPR